MAQPISRPATREDLPNPGEVITFNGYIRKHFQKHLIIGGKKMPKGINNISAARLLETPATETTVYLGLGDDLYSVNVTRLAWELTKKTDDNTPDEYRVTGIVERYNTVDEDDIYAYRDF